MPEPQPDWPHTLEEFRIWHERQPDVWEFIDGALRLMTPGSKAHTLVKSNVHAAFAQAFDQDEIIREERENLKRAQDEWREKLRKAEVDISLERAKLARERSELEERLQRLESQRSQDVSLPPSADGDKSKKSGRKWLARLGLKEGEE